MTHRNRALLLAALALARRYAEARAAGGVR